jgi:hypothetical protein
MAHDPNPEAAHRGGEGGRLRLTGGGKFLDAGFVPVCARAENAIIITRISLIQEGFITHFAVLTTTSQHATKAPPRSNHRLFWHAIKWREKRAPLFFSLLSVLGSGDLPSPSERHLEPGLTDVNIYRYDCSTELSRGLHGEERSGFAGSQDSLADGLAALLQDFAPWSEFIG